MKEKLIYLMNSIYLQMQEFQQSPNTHTENKTMNDILQ